MSLAKENIVVYAAIIEKSSEKKKEWHFDRLLDRMKIPTNDKGFNEWVVITDQSKNFADKISEIGDMIFGSRMISPPIQEWVVNCIANDPKSILEQFDVLDDRAIDYVFAVSLMAIGNELENI